MLPQQRSMQHGLTEATYTLNSEVQGCHAKKIPQDIGILRWEAARVSVKTNENLGLKSFFSKKPAYPCVNQLVPLYYVNIYLSLHHPQMKGSLRRTLQQGRMGYDRYRYPSDSLMSVISTGEALGHLCMHTLPVFEGNCCHCVANVLWKNADN